MQQWVGLYWRVGAEGLSGVTQSPQDLCKGPSISSCPFTLNFMLCFAVGGAVPGGVGAGGSVGDVLL